MMPIWFIVIMIIAFSWLLVEMRIFIKAWNEYYRQPISQPLELAIAKSDMPYHWKTTEQKEQCLMLCQGCYLTCKRDRERWTAWELPARTIRAWGSTLNFTEGCNVQRASLLKAIAKAQKSKAIARYPTSQSSKYAWQYDGGFEPTIDISVNGKTFSANGDYKKGSIKQFVRANK